MCIVKDTFVSIDANYCIETEVYMDEDVEIPFDIKAGEVTHEFTEKDVKLLIKHLQKMLRIKKTGVIE